MKIAHIDTGHGGADRRNIYVTPGKQGPEAPQLGYYEGVMNRKIGYIIESFNSDDFRAQVISGGLVDAGLSARRRCIKKICRPGDVFVSIHNNAIGDKWQTKAMGPRILYGSKKSLKLAECIAASMDAGKPRWRPALGIYRGAPCPAVLVECSFMDSLADVERMTSRYGAYDVALKIKNGIQNLWRSK